MVYSKYCKLRILYLRRLGYCPAAITRTLRKEKLKVSSRGVAKFLKRFRETGTVRRCYSRICLFANYTLGTIARAAGSGRRSVITDEVKAVVEQQMRRDDETTASQLHVMLTHMGYTISLRTILRCRTSLGWTFRGSAYCQLIRDVNKQKRLDFALANDHDNFANVIFTDECSVQLESHRRRCCRKEGERPRNKPRCASLLYKCNFTSRALPR